MSHFFLFADSRFKINGTNSNFQVNHSSSNLEPGVEVSVSVDSVTFYNSEYPVNTYNNTIQFREALDDVTTYTATLTPGNYSGSELALEMQSQLNSATGNAYTYSVSFNDNTGKLTIGGLLIPDVFKIVSIDSTYGIDVMSSFSVTTTGSNIAILAGVEYVDLCLPSLISGNMSNNPNEYGLMKRVSLNYPWGSLITYEQQESDQSVIIQKEYLDNLRIQLKRPDGRFYDLSDNSYLSVVLKCTYRL